MPHGYLRLQRAILKAPTKVFSFVVVSHKHIFFLVPTSLDHPQPNKETETHMLLRSNPWHFHYLTLLLLLLNRVGSRRQDSLAAWDLGRNFFNGKSFSQASELAPSHVYALGK